MPASADALPVDAVLPDLLGILSHRNSAVLVAPPGAGKTTRVPLALLDAAWLGDGRIMVLEPRRLAARGAARHMAQQVGERLGERIGVRARLGTVIGPATRIEVVTEGVFTRMILDDPTLHGIGAVLFDEFHERSLDTDLGLALALDAQAGLRDDLRIVVMSATIDAARVAGMLGDASIISCEGRSFPVETRYLGRDSNGRLDERVAAATLQALQTEPGSALVFLPGQAEIRRVAERLKERIRDPHIDIVPLYAGLDASQQDDAISPSRAGRRKVVLATSIAETSLTIEGIRIVIDSGLARVPRYEPGSGLTRLQTVRVSRASADQRRGRAGRVEPGVCYRLWAQQETQSLAPFADPEIRNADLSRLLIDCATWGVTDPSALAWLDAPPGAALATARNDLTALGAIGTHARLTDLGRRISRLPLPPRVAAMLLQADELGLVDQAAEIAAILVERGLGGNDTDLTHRIATLRSDKSDRAVQMRQLARQWAAAAHSADAASAANEKPAAADIASPAAVLALAFPDRIAKARGREGLYLMANGRAARLDEDDPLAREPYLVIAETTGGAPNSRIRLACPLTEAELEQIAGDRIEAIRSSSFDPATAGVKTRSERRLGAIRLGFNTQDASPGDDTAVALCAGIVELGIDRLPWSRSQLQMRERVLFLREHDQSFPDLSDSALGARAAEWLLPFLAGKVRLADIDGNDLAHALDLIVSNPLRRRLEHEAPSHFEAPTGSRHPIDYRNQAAPTVSIRVQELFGLNEHPRLAGGAIPLSFELLSPAMRPIQITSDLPTFWRGSWRDVRAQMRGRYPKHEWPEDPANAKPTTRAKQRR
ncbi:MAG: ATP-dependent helicase HrpB [Pseudorhodoplanes sp.]